MSKQQIMRMLREALIALLIIVLSGMILLFTIGPSWVARHENSFAVAVPPPVSAAAQRLHGQLLIADLHADTLLWARDPLKRAAYGHVDIPRLVEANVALQVFSEVTQVPSGRNYQRTENGFDLITVLAVVQRWPVATWSSRTERALYLAERLYQSAARSDGALTVIETVADLERYLARRDGQPDITAGVLAIEGLQALDGRIENLERLYDAGYRMMGLTHFFDNDVAGSAHGVKKGGLTPFGEVVLARMEARSIIVDLAHLSSRAIDDVLDRATRPVVVSHTGVVATCPGPRNLSDAQIRRIAAGGGVIGIAFFEAAICDVEPAAFARAVRHVVDLVGIEHVGLGSDHDGTVHTKFDVTGLPQMTEALLVAGFSESDIAQIMGGNVFRLLRENLPE